MSINTENDWKVVELRAQLAEAGQIHCEPVPSPTIAQQLLWVTTELAQAKARINRIKGLMATAHMYLSIGEAGRAQEALNKGILDL